MYVSVFEPYWKRRILGFLIAYCVTGIVLFILESSIDLFFWLAALYLVLILVDFVKLKKIIITHDKIAFDYYIMKNRNFAIRIDKIDRVYFLFRAKEDPRFRFYLKGVKSPTVVVNQLSHTQIKELYFVLKGFNIKLEGSKVLYTILKG